MNTPNITFRYSIWNLLLRWDLKSRTWESRRTRRVGGFYQGPWVTESGSESSVKLVEFERFLNRMSTCTWKMQMIAAVDFAQRLACQAGPIVQNQHLCQTASETHNLTTRISNQSASTFNQPCPPRQSLPSICMASCGVKPGSPLLGKWWQKISKNHVIFHQTGIFF